MPRRVLEDQKQRLSRVQVPRGDESAPPWTGEPARGQRSPRERRPPPCVLREDPVEGRGGADRGGPDLSELAVAVERERGEEKLRGRGEEQGGAKSAGAAG